MKASDMYQPQWFVQTADHSLHGYFTLEVLLCDLSANRGERVTILERSDSFLTRYAPITEADLREKHRRRA